MRRTEPGSALIMAAFAAALLATAAGIMLVEARSARGASGEALRLARAELQAQRLIAVGLVTLDSNSPTPTHGVIYADPSGGRVLRQDAATLLDINAAEPFRLAAHLVSLGFTQQLAETYADRIADWRDGDDLRRPQGAEREMYEDAGVAPPANRPFVVETEISAVLGVSVAMATCLATTLTTYSGLGAVESIASIATADAANALTSGPPLGRVIILTAEAPLSAHALLRRRVWVRLTGDARRPFIIHRAAQDLTPADAQVTDCAQAGSAP